MTLEGAIKLNETNDYIIYTMNSVTSGQYGVVVPKNVDGVLNMLVDLHMKSSFDGVGNGTRTKEQLVSDIGNEYDKIKTKYAYGMLVMPMMDEVMFQSTVVNNDKQKMFDEVKKIGAITSELYKKLTDSGIDKQKIDQKIIIVEKNQDDEKFVMWLKEQMPNFVDGVLYSEFGSNQSTVNPFVSGDSIFGPAPVATNSAESTTTSAPTVSGGIFDNVAPLASANPVEPIATNASVETPVVLPTVENVAPVAPVVEPVADLNQNANVDIFGIPLDVQGVQQNVEVVNNNATTSNDTVPNVGVASTQTPVVEAPRPVASSPLDGTTTFSPVQDASNVNSNIVTESNGDDGTNITEHASKGFANLLILLVVLIGVTIASIELGKFLYSVYGA